MLSRVGMVAVLALCSCATLSGVDDLEVVTDAGSSGVGGSSGAGGSGGVGGTSGAGGAGGTSGAGGAGGSGGTGGTGGGSIQCSQYLWGYDPTTIACHAYAPQLVQDVSECTMKGSVVVACDLCCVNDTSACVKDALTTSVSVDTLCHLSVASPVCLPFCDGSGSGPTSKTAYCASDGTAQLNTEYCLKFQCEQATGACHTNCKDNTECYGATCTNGFCI